jgi:tripartite-type tricarboxylate transporter receptor subunit TctC
MMKTIPTPAMRARRALLAAAGLLPLSRLARASGADNRPIEWVVGYAAGGGSDVVARLIAEPMGKTLGQAIVIVNKPGAATNIAADYVARSRERGRTLFSGDFATLAANPALFDKLSYDAARDLAPVGMIARFPLILVVAPSVPAGNFKEFLAWAKARPQGVTYASPGAGTAHHLATELLRERTGLNLVHVPYRGAAPAVQDLLGNQVDCMLIDSASGLPHIAGGKLRALGVTTGGRTRVLPQLQTLAEQGLAGFDAYSWQGLTVPTATLPEDVKRFNAALVAALQSEAVQGKLLAMGVEPTPGTPQQMAAYVGNERERWGKLIRERGIKVD